MAENDCRAVKTFAVYVFGIVVDEWMKELVVELRKVVSRVRALDVLRSPEPRSVLNDEPPRMRLVVLAVANEE